MAGAREPAFEVVIGFKGVGKTYTTNEIIDEYIKNDPSGRKGRPVLVFDVNNEYDDGNGYYGYKAIDFDIREKGDFKRSEQIRKITAPGKYRILPFRKDRQPMSLGEIQTTASTIVKNYRNGMLVLEDINKYTLSNFSQEFVGMFIGIRHLGVDLVAHFQSLRAIPPKVWSEMTHLRWHKQSEKIIKYKGRVTALELFSIAECIVDRKYLSDPHYYLWISVLEEKLINVSPEDFRSGCIDFLNQNRGELERIKKQFGEDGSRKYKTDKEAIDGYIKIKSEQYLAK
jgi:hypothetical protein